MDAGRTDSSLADARVEEAGGGGDAGIEFVQGNDTSPNDVMTQTTQVQLKAAQNAGDLNVVAVGWYDGAAIDSVTDSANNVYVLAVGPTTTTGGTGTSAQAMYYAAGIAAAAAGTNVVTVRWNRLTDSPDVRVVEYRGLDRQNPFDVSSTMAGKSVRATSAPVTTHFAPALLVAAGTSQDSFYEPGMGFTKDVLSNGDCLVQRRNVFAIGTYSADAPLEMSDSWVMQLVAFH